MTRGNARELAVHLIYSRGFVGEEPIKLVCDRLEKDYYNALKEENQVYTDHPDPTQRGYVDSVVCGVANREEELNEIIAKFSIGWDISRISRLTKSILQLAVFEILYMEDVPAGVAISEAVRIVKLYDSSDAGSFVNGILGSFVRSLNNQTEEEKCE